jgi:hypothetical protein
MDMTDTDLPGGAAIDSYIGRVDAAARALPPDRRIELLDQLREHLEAVSLAPDATESSVLAAIDRLGDPAEIVASEDPAPTGAAGHVAPSRSVWGPLEIMAVLLLVAGALLFLVGQLGGLLSMWFSAQWTRNEKVGVTIFVLGLFSLAAFSVFAPMWGLPDGFFLLWLLVSPFAGIFLAVRLARRPAGVRPE